MIYEVVVQSIDPARRDEHIEAYRRAWQEADFEGWRGGKILTSVEDPGRVILLIEWDSVEAHTRHRGTPRHDRFREAIRSYQTAPSDTGHYLIQEL